MKKLFVLTAATFMALAGCTKETGSNPDKNSGFGDAAFVNVYLNAPGSRALTGTTQPGDPAADGGNENLVTVLEFYVFDDTGANLDPAVFMTSATTDPGYYKITAAELADDDNWPYKTQIKMSAGASKQILVVANANVGAPAVNATFDDVMKKITAATMVPTGTTPNTRKVPTAGFEMTGYVMDAEVVANRGDNKIAVDVARLVNRIEAPVTTSVTMGLDADELAKLVELTGGDPEAVTITNGDVTFGQTGWAVVNGLSKSSVGFVGNATYNWKHPHFNAAKGETAADIVPWDLWLADSETAGVVTPGAFETARGPRLRSSSEADILAGTVGKATWQKAYSGVSVNSGWFLNGTVAGDKVVYAYESKPGVQMVNNIIGYDADYVISFIIEGTLTADGKTVTRYWRVNLLPDDAYHMMRNAVYQTTITKINTLGYKTPQEAEESEEIVPKPGETVADFTINVLDWDVNVYETEM